MCPGDALGIYPQNCAADVDEILMLAGWKDSQPVDVPANAYQPVDGILLDFFLIRLTHLHCCWTVGLGVVIHVTYCAV